MKSYLVPNRRPYKLLIRSQHDDKHVEMTLGCSFSSARRKPYPKDQQSSVVDNNRTCKPNGVRWTSRKNLALHITSSLYVLRKSWFDIPTETNKWQELNPEYTQCRTNCHLHMIIRQSYKSLAKHCKSIENYQFWMHFVSPWTLGRLSVQNTNTGLLEWLYSLAIEMDNEPSDYLKLNE